MYVYILGTNFTKLAIHEAFDAAMRLTYFRLNIVKNLLRIISHNMLHDLRFELRSFNINIFKCFID